MAGGPGGSSPAERSERIRLLQSPGGSDSPLGELLRRGE
jgi:hypothetical protein